ncbi:hypothetical protein BDA96_02G151400 [Sorghum bicolor]|uniref:Uncharacterized protein n=1 Tax=Sorghum bicolor TaxID=4558 RepID=A0A921RMJ4_SORBI|nr:hypothetical protein BDA96_02G151400 [Sorghum bicolor]
MPSRASRPSGARWRPSSSIPLRRTTTPWAIPSSPRPPMASPPVTWTRVAARAGRGSRVLVARCEHGEVRRGDVHEGAHQEQVAADQHHGLAPQAPGDAARQQRPHHAERIQRQREGRQRLVVVDAVHVLVAAARRALEQAWEELLQESLHLRHTSWTLLQVATDGATEFICSMSVLVFSVFYLLDGDA